MSPIPIEEAIKVGLYTIHSTDTTGVVPSGGGQE